MAPLGPPELVQPLLLGHGVAPPGRLPGLGRGVALLGCRPDLGRRVAPLSHSCTFAAWHPRPLPLTLDVG